MPMSVQFGPDAVSFRLGHAEARALVVYETGLERFADLLHEGTVLEAVLVVDATTPAAGRARADGPRFMDYEEALAGASPALDAIDTAATDPSLLLYTSGTTGPPKGVLHMHQWVLGNMPGIRFSHNFFPRGDDLFWTPADWAWGGRAHRRPASLPVFAGSRSSPSAPASSTPSGRTGLMVRHTMHNAFLPPTALKLMRRQRQSRPAGVQMRSIAACGGEALGEELLGLDRSTTSVSSSTSSTGRPRPTCGSATARRGGRWSPGRWGRRTPVSTSRSTMRGGNCAGTTGEICLRMPSPTAFREYWREPDKTAEKVRGGWLRSGDLGRMDDDGYLWFEGRTDDLIGSGGYRIGPTGSRGVPARAPGGRDVRRDRRARRDPRRGRDGVRHPQRRRGARRRARDGAQGARQASACLLPVPPQDPLRRRVADDHHREDHAQDAARPDDG